MSHSFTHSLSPPEVIAHPCMSHVSHMTVSLYTHTGLWLSPPEVNALMAVLDEDGGGDIRYKFSKVCSLFKLLSKMTIQLTFEKLCISYTEWLYFWKLHVDLDTGQLKKDDEVICCALQHTATHCNTLQHTATHCTAQKCTAARCAALQHTATQCTALQHT